MRFFILYSLCFIFSAPSPTRIYIYSKKEYRTFYFSVWNPSIYQHFWNVFGKQFVTGKVPEKSGLGSFYDMGRAYV